jgi:3-hydroxyacyl-[acyl-carrier-protein] dehydratase
MTIRTIMDRSQIESLIPHRSPFLWVDQVAELEPGVRCVALKFIDPAEPFFAGHFPGEPTLPGVFLIEAVAQTAGVMMAGPAKGEGIPMLAAVNRFKFLKAVRPGSRLRIEVRKLTEAGAMAYIEGTVQVGNEIVARGELSVVSAENRNAKPED